MGILPHMEREDELGLARKKKFQGHNATKSHFEGQAQLVPDYPPSPDRPPPSRESGIPSHINRRSFAPAHAAPSPDASQAAAVAQGAPIHGTWETTSMRQQIQATGQGRPEYDGVGSVRRWHPGKKILSPGGNQPLTSAAKDSGMVGRGASLGGLAGAIPVSHDPRAGEKLAQGTWKAGAHVPGYTGHISKVNPVLQPGEGKSLNKDEHLFAANYQNAYHNYKGVNKLVPEF